MKPNPGGQNDPENILGRESLIERMWEVLDGRSIYMSDNRRVGKSAILDVLGVRPPAGWRVLKRDLGGVHAAAEFSTEVFRDSLELSGGAKGWLRRMRAMVGELKGVDIAGVLKLPNAAVAPWKDVLRKTFADLQDELQESDERLVFLWDEVPYMLDNVSKREGETVAMEVLDLLRSLSQDHSRIRMVLTGSVGMHHVLKSLWRAGYGGSPLNTMEQIAPGPIGSDDAERLALELLDGAKIASTDRTACARAIADATGCVPFYIHKLISRLPTGEATSPTRIRECLDREIRDPAVDWDLAHYRRRLRRYYGDDESCVLHILDSIAEGQPIHMEDIRREVGAKCDLGDPERLRELLGLLRQDHYLDLDLEDKHSFRYSLVRDWWLSSRGLRRRA